MKKSPFHYVVVFVFIFSTILSACGTSNFNEWALWFEGSEEFRAENPEYYETGIDWILEQCKERSTAQQLNPAYSFEMCNKSTDALQSSALLIVAIGTPFPGDEELAAIKMMGVIKNSAGLIEFIVILATAEVALQAFNTQVIPLVSGETVHIPTGTHSSPEHDPLSNGSAAQLIILAMMTAFGGDPEDTRCFALMIGDATARIIWWTFTHESATGIPRGDIAWAHANGELGGAYPNKSGNTLQNVPKDISEKYPDSRIDELDDCPQFPGLTPAH